MNEMKNPFRYVEILRFTQDDRSDIGQKENRK